MKAYDHVMSRVFNRPLLITESKAAQIAWVLAERLDVPLLGVARPDAAAEPPHSRELKKAKGYMVTPDGVAVLGVNGTLVHKSMTAEPPSGFWSYTEIENQLLDAAADPSIRAIALDIDSPGGEAVDSAYSLAAAVRRVGATKPLWAIADEQMTSAAYLVASGAGRIVAPGGALTGSIGTIAMHVDRSEQNAKAGMKVTMVYAGARKADLSPHAPLSPDGLALLSKVVQQEYGRFVDLVAMHRGLDRAAILATEAGVFTRAEEARAAGLLDEVMAPDEAVAALAQLGVGRRVVQVPAAPAAAAAADTPEAAAAAKETDMTDKTPAAPAASAAAPAIDVAAIRAEAAAAERARIAALEEHCPAGYEQQLAAAKADGKTTAAEFAMMVARQEKLAGNRALSDMRDNGAKGPAPAAAPAGQAPIDENLPLEDQVKAEWLRSPQTRAEFGDSLDRYMAFRKANATGRVRLLSRKAS